MLPKDFCSEKFNKTGNIFQIAMYCTLEEGGRMDELRLEESRTEEADIKTKARRG
jgi:hypothetical protein